MPSKRTLQIEQNILAALRVGTPLAVVCREEGMPHPTTWRDWCDADPALAIAYARARDEGFDAIATECLTIADDASQDTKIVGEDEREVCNTEFVQRSKLRIETRLKLLAKWDPKRYGERQTTVHEDPQGNNPFASLMEAVSANGRPRPGS